MIHLVLPYPPSINTYYGRTRSGQVFIKEKGRNYRDSVIKSFTSKDTISDRIKLEVHLYVPDLRKRDLDNILKCLLDSLTHAKIYEDDSLIDDLRIIRKEKIKDGKCEVFISKIVDNSF